MSTLTPGHDKPGEQDTRLRPEPLPGSDHPPARGEPPAAHGNVDSTIFLPHVTPRPGGGRYRLQRLHARGGMGEVYLAEDAELGRIVAYKRIRSDRESLQERFYTEAQVTGQLEHPGIVPVHEMGRDDEGQPFYVMRLVQGQTLKHAIRDYHGAVKARANDVEILRLRLLETFLDLCRTIAYAHSRGVIHRDLKPDNVMIGPYGETLVLDWGLCKLRGMVEPTNDRPYVRVSWSAASTATQSGQIMGSLPYMSPEMAEGRLDEADEQTDVYLLGSTLYEILTNQPPRQGGGSDDILELAKHSPPLSPRKINPNVPRVLEAICDKAMAHRKLDRYASADELAAELERYLAGEQVQAYPEPLAERLWRWLRRHRQVLARASVVLLIAAIAGGAGLAWSRANARARLAELESRRLQQAAQADRDAERFLATAEQLRFTLSNTTPLDEIAPVADTAEARKLLDQLLETCDSWGATFDQFPDANRRDVLSQELRELLLWVAQNQLAAPQRGIPPAELLKFVERAERLGDSSRSCQLLKAECLKLLARAADAQQATAAGEPLEETAFDLFLRGEALRTRALNPSSPAESRTAWRPGRQDMEAAVRLYRRVIDGDARNYWAHLQLGRSLLLLDEPEEALAELNMTVALRPESAWGHAVRGLALAVLGVHQAAEQDLQRALALRPGLVSAQLNLVALWLMRQDPGDLARATQLLRELEQAAANSPFVHYYAGLAQFTQEDFDGALKSSYAAIRASAAMRPAYLLRAQVQICLGDDEAALADLNSFLSRGDPAFDEQAGEAAARRSGLLRLLYGKLPRAHRARALRLAVDEAQQAIARKATSAALYDDYGALLQTQGKISEAIAAYTEALQLEPDETLNGELLLKRGFAYLSLPEIDYERAAGDYRAAAQHPGDDHKSPLIRAEAHAMLGYVAACRDDAATAQREATLALAAMRGSQHYTLGINLACVYARLSEVDAQRRQDLQDAAVFLLREACAAADRKGRLREARQAMRLDPALQPLQARNDFRELLGEL